MKGERRTENRTRKMVLNYVDEHPGSTLPEIKRVLQIPEGTLRYHIDYLSREDRIFSRKKKGKRCYYPSELGGRNALLSRDPDEISREQSRILDTIKDEPGISYRDILKRTNLSRNMLSRNLGSLKRKGVVWQIKNGGEAGYEHITDRGLRKEMLKLLVMRLLEGDIDEETFMSLKDEINK